MKAPVVLIHHVAGAYDNEVLRPAAPVKEINMVIHPQRNRSFGFLGDSNLGGIHTNGLEADLDHGVDCLGGESLAQRHRLR